METETVNEIVRGVTEIIVCLLPIIFGGAYFGNKAIKKSRKKKEQQAQQEDTTSRTKLKYHPLFARMDMYLTYVNTSFHLENKGKQEVFRCLLMNEIQNRKKLLYDLAIQMDRCASSCTESLEECNKLYNKNLDALTQGTQELNNFYLKPEWTEDERDVLKIVIEKFNRWHDPHIQRLNESLGMICNSKFYPDCYVKQAVIFDMYLGTVSDMLSDAEKTLNELNGDLNGRVFRGIVIGKGRK